MTQPMAKDQERIICLTHDRGIEREFYTWYKAKGPREKIVFNPQLRGQERRLCSIHNQEAKKEYYTWSMIKELGEKIILDAQPRGQREKIMLDPWPRGQERRLCSIHYQGAKREDCAQSMTKGRVRRLYSIH